MAEIDYELEKEIADEIERGTKSALESGSVSLFESEKLASKFCEQYGYERGSGEYAIATNAFCVGLRIGGRK